MFVINYINLIIKFLITFESIRENCSVHNGIDDNYIICNNIFHLSAMNFYKNYLRI